MKIAIDVSSAAKAAPTGIARYQIELVRALAHLMGPNDHLFPVVRLNRWRKRGHLAALRGLPRVGHVRLFLPRVDILHTAGIARPRRTSGLRVVTVHDTATIDTPELSTPGFAESHARNMRRALAGCDLVLTVSDFVRGRVLNHFPDLEPQRVVTVHHGSDHLGLSARRGADDDEVLERFGLADQRYVLFIGRIERRKNPEGLVRAFACAAPPDRVLVFAGSRGDSNVAAAIDTTAMNARVRFLGRPADCDLGALYRGAEVFALPSYHEGFGIPLLEAMACGTPSLAAEGTALPEIAGQAALLVDPGSDCAIARGLKRLIGDRELRDTLRERGPVQAAKFTWRRCARETLDAYRRVLELGRRS